MRLLGRRDGADRAGPVATYAAVLDGAHLWWHVPGIDRLTLREVGGSNRADEVVLDADPFPLTGLGGAAYDVLADGTRVRVATLPDRHPARAPLSPDGTARYDAEVVDGCLRLTRTAVAATAILESVATGGDGVRLRVRPPDGPGAATSLILTDEHDGVLATLPTRAASAGTVEAVLTVAALPSDVVGVLRIAVGSPETRVRIRRSDTGLADPNHAVLLPELVDPEQGGVRARLRWSPDALLAIRLLDPDVEDSR